MAGLLVDQPKEKVSFQELWDTQWDDKFQNLVETLAKPDAKFIELCRNRMVMGGMRYGRLIHQTNGNGYANLTSAAKRLNLFCESGNSEWLCDVYNLAMIEFKIGHHPKKHHTPFSPILWPIDPFLVKLWMLEYMDLGDTRFLVGVGAWCLWAWQNKAHPDFHWESGDRKENHPEVHKS